jgi:hypothetical protein
MPKRLEALADAIASLNLWQEPDSEAYKLRNPGLLRSYALRHAADEHGRRVFSSLMDGYGALLYDLQTKCSGHSRSKLRRNSTLDELLVRGYSQPSSSMDLVLCFLEKALPDHINQQTHIEFFLEKGK